MITDSREYHSMVSMTARWLFILIWWAGDHQSSQAGWDSMNTMHHVNRMHLLSGTSLIGESKGFSTVEAHWRDKSSRNWHAVCQAKWQVQISEANNIQATLPSTLQKAVEIAKETGVSARLTVLPVSEHRLALHKRSLFWYTLPSVWMETPTTTPSHVISALQWSMCWVACMVDCLLFVTMKWETSLPILWVIFATMLGPNQFYNPSLMRDYTIAVLTLMREHMLTSKQRASGKTTDSVHFWPYGFNPLAHTYRSLPFVHMLT